MNSKRKKTLKRLRKRVSGIVLDESQNDFELETQGDVANFLQVPNGNADDYSIENSVLSQFSTVNSNWRFPSESRLLDEISSCIEHTPRIPEKTLPQITSQEKLLMKFKNTQRQWDKLQQTLSKITNKPLNRITFAQFPKNSLDSQPRNPALLKNVWYLSLRKSRSDNTKKFYIPVGSPLSSIYAQIPFNFN